jgi:hypothetical protein
VRAGETVSVHPNGVVQPLCQAAQVWRTGPTGSLEAVGIVSPNGAWQPYGRASGSPPPTFLACAVPPSSDAIVFLVPPDLSTGAYVWCVTFDVVADGCASVEIQ